MVVVVVEVTEEQLEGGGGGRVETRPTLLSAQRGGPRSSWSSAEEDLTEKPATFPVRKLLFPPLPPASLPPSTHHAVCQHKAFNLLTSGGCAGQTG